MDAHIQNIHDHAEQREAKERTAIEGAKQLVAAAGISLGAAYSDDSQARRSENEQAQRLEADAYKKLAYVDVEQAKALVELERSNVKNDAQLQNSIWLDEAKLAAAAQALNADANNATAIANADAKEIQNPAALELVAASRASDTTQALEAVGLNAIEPNIERQQLQQKLSAEEDEKRSAWVKKAEPAKQVEVATEKVESDEIFTASQQEVKPVVPPDIEKQYLRVGDKFYHPKNTDLVAFEDKGNKLETKSSSESIAESMVRIAEARGWDEIKVSGSETFRKQVWLEAASRGMHVKGYSPSEKDKAELAKRGSSVETNKVEKDNKPFRARENDNAQNTDGKGNVPAQPSASASVVEQKPATPRAAVQNAWNVQLSEAFVKETASEAVKKHPELAGAVAAVTAMDKKAEADGLTPEQRTVVAARVRQNVMNSIERGEIPQMKVKEEREVARRVKDELEQSR